MIQHKAIAASAGSGKTFQLTNRYIGLMIAGVNPNQIIALTFSRKAAGEILDKIIQRLAAAAASDAEAAVLNRVLHESGCVPGGHTLTAADAAQLLRQLVFDLPVSRISTIDSFFVGILNAFPFEFGLNGQLQIMSTFDESAYRREAMKRVLDFSGDGVDADAFLEMFKQATFGREEKSLAQLLGDFVEKSHKLYLEAPADRLWGNESVIWPDGCRWLEEPDKDTEELRAAWDCVRKYLDTQEDMDSRLKTGLTELCQEAVEASPGSRVSSKTMNYLKKLLADIDDLREGRGCISYNRRDYDLPEDCSRALCCLCSWIVTCDYVEKLNSTRGTFAILSEYARQYDSAAVQGGHLSFNDIPFLLTHPGDGHSEQLCFTTRPDEAARLFIDYRLDSQLRHWLIDEFQDTSTIQWQVMRNLIDEVLQSADGDRSFFYVGDIKQAIYGWRGGDSELFHAVLSKYNRERSLIRLDQLSRSWRSSRAVISTVNGAFDALDEHDDLPAGAAQRWCDNWQEHVSAKADLPGYAAFYEIPRLKRDSDGDKERCRQMTCSIIRDIRDRDSSGGNVSIAVLVRNNKAGVEVAQYLRSNRIPAVWEGNFKITDNALVVAFLSLVKAAEHPCDRFAWEHLMMTPLAQVIRRRGLTRASISSAVLHDIFETGFEQTLSAWGCDLFESAGWERDAAVDEFARLRFEQLLSLARSFDQAGGRSCSDFIEFVKSYDLADTGAGGMVQVMTVHKSKGLEFDAVILPDLSGSSLATYTAGGICLNKERNIYRTPRWALAMPRKDFAVLDPVLDEFMNDETDQYCYEELCNLYVAMTRAKHALYMIATEQSSGSNAVYPATLLRRQLAGADAETVDWPGFEAAQLYQTGDPAWSSRLAAPAAAAEAAPAFVCDQTVRKPARPRRRFERQTPSGAERKRVKAPTLFSASRRHRAELGTAVHSLFEKFEWSGSADLQAVIERWQLESSFADELQGRAAAEFRTALDAPEIEQALRKPQEHVQLWREKHFEVILDDAWISGVFDRVHILTDAAGTPAAAEILDFKTDRVASADALQESVNVYRPQIKLYQKVLSKMLGLAPAKIRLRLLFTGAGRAVDVE